MAIVAKWFSYIEKRLLLVSAAIIFLMMSLTTVDVGMRYLLNSPIEGTYELIEFLLVGAGALGFAYVQRVREHVAISLITESLPTKTRSFIGILILILMLIISALITWRSGLSAAKSIMTGEVTIGVTAFPVGPARAVIPLGFGLLCLRIVIQIAEGISSMSREVPHE
jgi:TRAP-type C4-dicarboxylate transport system permease small subunit